MKTKFKIMKNESISLIVCVICTLFYNLNVNAQETGTYTDSRDSITYKTVKIGEQWWIAENIKYQPNKKFATKQDRGKMLLRDSETGKAYVATFIGYANNESNVETYGYLYDWETACTVCPDGWHLPNLEEWRELISFLGKDFAGTKMKEVKNDPWKTSKKKIEITNSSGFSALPGGLGYSDFTFDKLGEEAFFWAYAKSHGDIRWKLNLDKKKNSSYLGTSPIDYFLSVRCIKNNTK